VDRALLLRISSATLFLVATAGAAAPPPETFPDPAPARGADTTHDLCGVELTVMNGRFSTGFTPQDDWDFTTSIGLWVGGRVDRGAGYVVSVSTGLYEQEFWSTDAPPPTSRATNSSAAKRPPRRTWTRSSRRSTRTTVPSDSRSSRRASR
jgi:hypothetical protein